MSMLREGSKGPAFCLRDQVGNMVRLSDFKGKNVALYFYVRDFTPRCTSQACDIRDNKEELEDEGIVTIGVSMDTIEWHRKFAEEHGLPFLLLSDKNATVAGKCGVYGQKSFMGRKFMSVKRATFLIDESGRIVKIVPKVDVNARAKQIQELFTEV